MDNKNGKKNIFIQNGPFSDNYKFLKELDI